MSYIRHIYRMDLTMNPVDGRLPVPGVPGVLPLHLLPLHPPPPRVEAEVVEQPLWKWLFETTNRPGWVPR